MLAYRHAFHAGNHADVLKHLVLIQVLRHMGLKDKPYRLVDTHAGGGAYRLDSEQAQKKGEYREGVARLWPLARAEGAAMPPAVRDYLDALLAFNGAGELLHYPGSPQLALAQRRAQDQLRFYELHPSEFRILGEQLGAPDALPAGVQLAQQDGFVALKSQLPPPSRRAVVLLDPSYELASDYDRLVDALRDALKRFAEGVYVVWYPQVSRVEASQLPRRLKALAPRGWLHARLSVQRPDAQGYGLMGSGMFVFNPPYTLHDSLAQALPWLVERLAQHEGASQLLEQHAV